MAMDEQVEFGSSVGVQSWDMLGVSGNLLLGSWGVEDVLLDYPLPGDIFVKTYGLFGDGNTLKKLQRKLLEDSKSNEQFGSTPKKPRLSLKLQRKSQPASSSDAKNTLDKTNEELSGSALKKLQCKSLEDGKSNEQFGNTPKKPRPPSCATTNYFNNCVW